MPRRPGRKRAVDVQLSVNILHSTHMYTGARSQHNETCRHTLTCYTHTHLEPPSAHNQHLQFRPACNCLSKLHHIVCHVVLSVLISRPVHELLPPHASHIQQQHTAGFAGSIPERSLGLQKGAAKRKRGASERCRSVG